MTVSARFVVWLVAVPLSAASAQRASPAVTGTRAFAIEALGGAAGSALGIAVGLAVANPRECPSDDDVACILEKLAVTGLVGVAGTTIGATVAGRIGGTRPSAPGALLGALAGAAAAIALEHLLTEEMGRSLGDAGTVLLFSMTQGILAAAGSGLGARIRDD